MQEAGMTAALVAVIIVLTKVIEWLLGRKDKQQGNGTVKLPEEIVRQMRETHERVNLLTSRDIGAILSTNEKMAEVLAKIAVSQERLVEDQTRLTQILQKMQLEQELRRGQN